jgi:hypothetical protein
LRDFNNALAVLAPAGVIVIDDVRPSSSLAAIPDRKMFHRIRETQGVKSGAWMGDVYRLVLFIESFYQQLSYRTIGDNHGQLVVWEQRRKEVTPRTVEQVARMSYEAMLLCEEHFNVVPYLDVRGEVEKSIKMYNLN